MAEKVLRIMPPAPRGDLATSRQ